MDGSEGNGSGDKGGVSCVVCLEEERGEEGRECVGLRKAGDGCGRGVMLSELEFETAVEDSEDASVSIMGKDDAEEEPDEDECAETKNFIIWRSCKVECSVFGLGCDPWLRRRCRGGSGGAFLGLRWWTRLGEIRKTLL